MHKLNWTFTECTYPCNHHPNQEIENYQHPINTLHTLCQLILPCSSPKVTIMLTSKLWFSFTWLGLQWMVRYNTHTSVSGLFYLWDSPLMLQVEITDSLSMLHKYFTVWILHLFIYSTINDHSDWVPLWELFKQWRHEHSHSFGTYLVAL